MASVMRTRVTRLVEAPRFQAIIIAVILINAAILGVETYSGLPTALLDILGWANAVIVGIFVIEIILRIYAHRKSFFGDPWGWFDLIIVVIALIPAGAGGEVLRVLRALRVLRLLSTVRSMRIVVGALLASLPGIASIGALLAMVMYIYAVIATELFAPAEQFQDLGHSLASLFRVLIGDGWGDVVTPVATTPVAWLIFISYAVITAIIVLNLLIAVAVEAMDRVKAQDSTFSTVHPQPEQEKATTATGADPQLLEEIRGLRAQLSAMESRLR